MRRRLFTLVMLAVLPLVAIIAYNLINLYHHLQDEALRTTQRDATQLATNVERFNHQLLEEAAAVGLAVVENELTPAQAERYLTALGTHIPIADYVILDVDGRVVASAVPQVMGIDISKDPAVAEILAGASTSVTGLRRTPAGAEGYAVMTRVKRNGRFAGISAVFVETGDIAATAPDVPPGAVVILTDQQGRLLYSNARHLRESPPARLRRFEPVRQALGGKQALERRIRLPGTVELYIGAQVPVDDFDWTAGYYLPRAAAIADIRGEVFGTSAVLAVLVLLLLLATRSYGVAITVPLTELTAAADEVRQGRFDAPVAVHAPDEIGVLAEDFRRMQASLAHTFNDVATLTEAAGRINSSLDVATILDVAFGYLRSVLDADVAVTSLVTESGRGVDVRSTGVDIEAAEHLAATVAAEYPGRSLFGRDHVLVDLAEHKLPNAVTPLGSRYLVVLPLTVRTRQVGRVDAYCTPKASFAEFSRSAIPLAVSLTRQLAIALANARLFERQQLIANTLQDSLLSEPYRLAGLDVEVEYRPASVGARIGGDFFDFIPIGEHAMAILLGDISGKGLDAARHTALAKGAIRTLAYEDPWPVSVLQRASRIIAEQTDASTFVTAVYVLADSQSGTLHYANAGHPPPLLASRLGDIRSLLGNGPPLGVMPHWDGEESEARLQLGDRLILYTDGLSEARRDHDFFGAEGVAQAAIDLRDAPLADVPAQLVLKAAQHARGRLADDIAVVVVEKTPRPEPDAGL